VHPVSAERFATSVDSGSADALTPFFNSASVTLKYIGSKPWDIAHTADARIVNAAFILDVAGDVLIARGKLSGDHQLYESPHDSTASASLGKLLGI
jgi:hypothetical protein